MDDAQRYDDSPAEAMVGEDALVAGPTVVAAKPQLALYRRYRPETFAEVIGQEHVTEPLMRALSNNRVNHAYLFSGPRGCGKTTSARILARALNCEQGPTPVPCGGCQSCRDLARGGVGSIDVIEIDAASHGGVEDARGLRESAFFVPVQSRYKIYIVDEAHMVTTAGFNAMLKVVEEPPPHVKFIFATTEPEKVIGTIRSRTHHYPFRLVPPKMLGSYLADVCAHEGIHVAPAVLPLVVRAGAGSVRDSLSVLDQLLGAAGEDGVAYQDAAALLGFTPDSLLDEIVDAISAGDGAGVFACVDKVIEVGQDPRRFAEDLLRRIRDLILVAAVSDAFSSGLVDVAADQAERLTNQSAALGQGELTRAAEVLAKGLTDMRGTTAPRLYLELMCSRILLPGADVDGRGVHARLDRLERRLGMPDDAGVSPQTRSGCAADAPTEVVTATEPGPVSGASVSPVGARGLPGETGQSRPRPQRPTAPAAAVAVQESTDGGVPDPAAPAPTVEPVGSENASVGPVDGGVPDVRSAVPGEPAAATSSDAPADRSRPQAFSTADMRREWTSVLEEVKNRKRFAFMLLSQNAQVLSVEDDRLVLAFASQGAREGFLRGEAPQHLRDALVAKLGLSMRIDTTVDARAVRESRSRASQAPSSDDDKEDDPAAPPEPAWEPEAESGHVAGSAPERDAAADQAPEPASELEQVPTPEPQLARESEPSPQQWPSAAGESRLAAVTEQDLARIRPVTQRPTVGALNAPPPDAEPPPRSFVRPTPTAARPSVPQPATEDVCDRDDPTVDNTGESEAELLRRYLGAELIGEDPIK